MEIYPVDNSLLMGD